MRLVFCGSGWLPIVEAIGERLGVAHEIAIWDRREPLHAALRRAEVILPSDARIDAEAVAAPLDLRLIQQPAAGIEGIDLAAARRRGVPVCNAPGANHVAVAEAATYLMLALARRQAGAARSFAEGVIGVPLGIELRGRTLGIIGPGRSGRALEEIATGMGMTVRSVGSRSSEAELLELCAAADVISVHCPLTPATRGLVGAEVLAAMKPGAFLINCARGPIVDRAALEAALDAGRLGGVGLDTYWREPWDPADPLFSRDEVVTLPHVAGSTEEAFSRIADIVCENVARVARGEPPLHRVD